MAVPKPTRFQEIANLGSAFFEAVKEHAKVSQVEHDALMDAAARHVRSASPQAMLKEQPPLTKVRVNFGERGGFVGTTLVGGRVVLFIHESTGRDAATEPLTAAEVTALASGLMAAKAATEVERG